MRVLRSSKPIVCRPTCQEWDWLAFIGPLASIEEMTSSSDLGVADCLPRATLKAAGTIAGADAKELHFPHDHDDWQWHRLAYLLENPELIFDDHARHVAKVFGLVHLLKFKSIDLGGVVILYTSKANVENAKALEHSSTRTFSHTIPRLVMSHCVTIPFTLDLGAVLQELKGALGRACYVILWDTSGGQYRIIAHHVGKERRNQLKELRGDDKTYCTESYGIVVDPSGHGPIASAARTGRQVFFANAAAPDAQTRHMRRAPLLSDFGIHDVYFLPVALGVLEFGLSKSPRDVAMEEIGRFKSMMGGSSVLAYVMFWSKVEEKDGLFHVVADYVCEDRKRQLRELRGDDRTFCSESYGALGLDPAGKSPIAVAARTGKQLSVTDAFTCPTFQRREHGDAGVQACKHVKGHPPPRASQDGRREGCQGSAASLLAQCNGGVRVYLARRFSNSPRALRGGPPRRRSE